MTAIDDALRETRAGLPYRASGFPASAGTGLLGVAISGSLRTHARAGP
jgi:hypothetical protein